MSDDCPPIRVADDDWPETQTNDGEDGECDDILVAGEARPATLDEFDER